MTPDITSATALFSTDDIGAAITFSSSPPRWWHPMRRARFRRRQAWERLHPPRIGEVTSSTTVTITRTPQPWFWSYRANVVLFTLLATIGVLASAAALSFLTLALAIPAAAIVIGAEIGTMAALGARCKRINRWK